ncbi:MAG TPA: ChaN family lipoprotein, partial [Oscillatoriaceae cyanobacterium]
MRARLAGIFSILLLALGLSSSPAPAREDWSVLHGDKSPARMSDVLAAMGRSDVVFVGESHPVLEHQRIEASLLRQAYAAYGQTRHVALSLEMMPTNLQPALDRYLRGEIDCATLVAAWTRWTHFDDTYRPAVDFAKAHGLHVVAADVPVKICRRVIADGLSALTPDEQKLVAPTPLPSPQNAWLLRYETFAPKLWHSTDDPLHRAYAL